MIYALKKYFTAEVITEKWWLHFLILNFAYQFIKSVYGWFV